MSCVILVDIIFVEILVQRERILGGENGVLYIS